jgi:RNA polymerase sigma factor (sigma-70 family)
MTEEEATRVVVSLYESWYAIVLRYASRVAYSADIAEDIVQEAFMQLYRDLLNGKQIRNLRAWTFCVVRRQASRRWDHFRRDTDRHDPLEVLDHLNAGRVAPSEVESEADRVQKFFRVLTRREEETILLRMAGLKYRAIAKELGITVSSVNSLLIRALRKLKTAIMSDELRDSSSHETVGRIPRALQ